MSLSSEEPKRALPSPCEISSGSASTFTSGSASAPGGGISGSGGDGSVRAGGYYTEVGPNDVVFGRGAGPNQLPGNVSFRRLVHSRRREYNAARTNRDKQDVAQEVMDRIRSEGRNPPGRFLRKVDPHTAKGKGFEKGQDVWTEVEDNVALEKVKQALRRQSRGEVDDCCPAAAAGVASVADEAGEFAGQMALHPNTVFSVVDSPGLPSQAKRVSETYSSSSGVSSSCWIDGSESRGLVDANSPEVGSIFADDVLAHDSLCDQFHMPFGDNAMDLQERINCETLDLGGTTSASATKFGPIVDNREEKDDAAAQETSHGSIDVNGFILSTDIGPNDVLLGRGKGTYQNPGNIAFRVLVAERQSEYIKAITNKEKNRIAKEVVDQVRYEVVPPGRFLAMVDKSVAASMGISGHDQAWCLADDKSTLEKAKQALRSSFDAGAHKSKKRIAKDKQLSDSEGTQGNVESSSLPTEGSGISISTVEMSAEDTNGTVPPNNSSEPLSPGLKLTSAISLDTQECEAAAKVATELTEVAPTVNDVFFPDHLGHLHASNIMSNQNALPSITGLMEAEDGIMKQVESTGEEPEETSRNEKSSDVLESVRVALELVKEVVGGHRMAETNHNVPASSEPSTGCDLALLGSKLYHHFAGFGPFDATGAKPSGVEEPSVVLDESAIIRLRKKERKSNSRKYVLLQELGFPVSLCILVSSLLNSRYDGAIDCYQTIEEVEKDLQLMIANPQRFLFDADADKQRGHLEFPSGELYGREQDISMLMSVLDRVTNNENPCEMVLISGYSGTGKSALVEQLRRPLAERNGHFISGKFDEWGQVQPMSIIFTAFDDFCSNLLEGDESHVAQLRASINDALGAQNVHVLAGLLPSLGTLMGVTVLSSFDIGGREALNRFIFYFRLFVRAIASPQHPVVLFLDDLQWADKSSLELITTLMLGRGVRSLLFIGSYRDNEVGLYHPLNEEAGNIAFAGIRVTKIALGNIDRESVNALISNALRLSPRLSRSLANIVYAKTSGNPLFVVQFLRSLCDEHLLQYSASSRRWEWDIEAIQSKEIADNVVDLITEKMLRLDPRAQKLLKESACLGSRFEASTLKLLIADGDNNGSGSNPIVDLAVNEGLLCKIDSSSYKFSHDRITQAAYSLIPPNEREACHLRIGRLLWRRASEEELEKVVFIIVDQLYRGSSLISDPSEKVEVAGLCLMAGKKATLSSAFMQASIYLLQGTTMLDENDWRHHYDLTLELFSRCAEAQYVTGANEGVSITSSPIFERGRCLEDKLHAYYTLLKSLGSQGKHADVIQIGVELLAQLGEYLPTEIHQSDVKSDFAKTRALLEGTTMDGILNMSVMEDGKKVAAMKILNITSRHAYEMDQQLLSLIVFRMVQLSLCHGICRESSFALATFASILCSFGEVEEGYLHGKLALSVLRRFKEKEYLARVYIVVYGMINTFKEPVQAILPSLKHGHTVGMSVGDIEWALTIAQSYTLNALQCGSKLETLAEEAREYSRQTQEHKHHSCTLILPCVQAILNLMACSGDPTVLTGEAMDQEDHVNSALEKEQLFVVNRVVFWRMWLACFFRRYDLAADLVRRRQEISKGRPFRLDTIVNETFYTGLIAAVLAREGDQGEWRNTAMEAAEKMKTWAAGSSWNFQHKLDLLNAEIAYLNRDLDGAIKAYDDAVRLAKAHGFIHEEALACEKAGIFYSKEVSPVLAKGYFERSYKCYVQWGAKRKADDLLSFLNDD